MGRRFDNLLVARTHLPHSVRRGVELQFTRHGTKAVGRRLGRVRGLNGPGVVVGLPETNETTLDCGYDAPAQYVINNVVMSSHSQ